MHESDDLLWQFKKLLYNSVTKAKNFVFFLFTYVSESHALLNGDFFMILNSVDSNEEMKQGDEALNTSSLLFLRSVKRFIATIFYSALNASLPLICKIFHCLTLHRHYLIKGIHHLMLQRHYLLK
jgi:hypothetical protein